MNENDNRIMPFIVTLFCLGLITKSSSRMLALAELDVDVIGLFVCLLFFILKKKCIHLIIFHNNFTLENKYKFKYVCFKINFI